jgi:hypothetical protein
MRRIVRAKINFLSLVPRGANQLPVIYKSDDSVELASLVKATDDFDEKGELLSVVYAPEMVDSQGDIASEETIKEMMYDAARDGFDIDIRHDGKALKKSDAFVAESFIIQKGDPRFDGFKNYSGETVDVTGGWATVLKIENRELRKAYRNGEWNGVSMAGTAEFAQEKHDDPKSFLSKLARFLKTSSDDGDIEMKTEELTAILKENNKALVESLAEALTKSGKPEGQPEGDKNKGEDLNKGDDTCPVPKPVLKNATDPKAVAKYQKELKAWKLAKEVDWEDPDAVEAYNKSLTENEVTVTDQEAGIEKEDSEEVADLKRRLAKAQRQSNVSNGNSQDRPAGDVQKQDQVTVIGISKEDLELMQAGQKAGQAHNKNRGI